MEVTSLREPKMADRVATVLRRMFIRGEITEGTMLPPESELMQRFGVSRPTLREAFRVLESESLIEVQRGVRGGARVTRPRRETLARYAAEGASPIAADLDRIEALGVHAIAGNFASEESVVRHDAGRVTDALLALGAAGRTGRLETAGHQPGLG